MQKPEMAGAEGAARPVKGWVPEWPAPPNVRAFMSTREGGRSSPPFDGLNLGSHVGDQSETVAANRRALAAHLQARPVFLNQVHGSACVRVDRDAVDGTVADACYTVSPGVACTVMVADCLPVLLTDVHGRMVAAAHAGWRGLAGVGGEPGVLPSVLNSFMSETPSGKGNAATVSVVLDDDAETAHTGTRGTLDLSDVLVWLGPCIGPEAFEVGEDVRAAFGNLSSDAEAVARCFVSAGGAPGKYWCDLAGLARLQLMSMGVTQVYGNDGSPDWCTVSRPDIWFSHRRDAARLGSSGRMAASIWLQKDADGYQG
jgi:copper oxidase (laccase) domain-containing protein